MHGVLLVAALLASTSCVLTPTDGTHRPSLATPFTMSGYDIEDGLAIIFQGRTTAGVFQTFGPTAISSSTPTTTSVFSGGSPIYSWSASNIVIPPNMRIAGARGFRAELRVIHRDVAGVLMSVNKDWLDCLDEHHASPTDFQTHCSSTNTPSIFIYTDDYIPFLNTGGDTTCAYGSLDCQVCVPNVPAAFARVRRNSPDLLGAHMVAPGVSLPDPAPPTGGVPFKPHIQGMTRLSFRGPGTSPYSRHDRYFVLSRNNEDGPGGLHVVRFESREGSHDDFGLPLDPPPAPSGSPLTGNHQRYYSLSGPVGLRHPGGMQAVGRWLAVPWEGSSGDPQRPAEIWFYDVLDIVSPGSSVQPVAPRLRLDGSRGERGQSLTFSGAAGVAMSRMADGHLLIFIGGQANSSIGWFYRSTTPYLGEETSWKYLGYWEPRDVERNGTWGYWQSFNFHTDCNDGSLCLFAMGSVGDGHLEYPNRTTLYRVNNAGGGGSPGLQVVAPAREYWDVHGNETNLELSSRFGATLHAGIDGNFTFYMSSRNELGQAIDGLGGREERVLWIDQFTPP